MPDESVLLDTLAAFARTLTRQYSVSDVLHDMVERVTAVLRLSGAGVSLLHEGQMQFATALSEAVADLERVQDIHQSGPCVDAALSGGVVTVDDLTESCRRQRWPEYCDRAERLGVRAVAGIPLLTHDRSIGAMNLYDTQPRAWSSGDIRAAQILADLATGFVVHASELEVHRNLAVQLQGALESRVVIEQAKGIIAQACGITVDQAFQRLRQHARNHNATIADVSAAVVDLGLRP